MNFQKLHWICCLLGSLIANQLLAEPQVELIVPEASSQLCIQVGPLDDKLWDTASQLVGALQVDQLLSVHVVGNPADKASTEQQPKVLGRTTIDRESRVIRFEPRFALEPGLSYLVRWKLLEDTTNDWIITVPKVEHKPSARVLRISPQPDRLPENLLKFYIHFSEPMSFGKVYEHIDLIDESGKHLEHPFLEIAEELWNPAGTRLTLLLDPARVKRGLVPHEEDGAILYAGRRYRLVVKDTWLDARGEPLVEPFEKSFSTLPADYSQPDPSQWELRVPKVNSSQPLVVDLKETLDHAIVARGIRVVDSNRQSLTGTVTLSSDESEWSFEPQQPWRAGTYSLLIDDRIEDLAGNSIAKPFEVDRFDQVESPSPRHVQIDFDLSAP